MVFNIQELFFYFEEIGVFDFLLPFLLVFAVVFGVLQFTKMFGEDKGVKAIIAIVIGILAVRYVDFTAYYGEIFPRLGVGLSILLALLLLVGMFVTDKSKALMMWIFTIVGIIIFVTVLYNSASVFGWTDSIGGGPGEWIAWIISAVLLIGVIVVVVMAKKEPSSKTPRTLQLFDTSKADD